MTKDDSTVTNKLELWLTPMQQSLLGDILTTSWVFYFAKAKGVKEEVFDLRQSFFKGQAKQG